MSLAVWIAIAIPIMLSFAPITNGTTKIDAKQLEKLRGSVRLPLPDALRDRVLSRIRNTERLALWGAVLGMAVMALVAAFVLRADASAGALVMLGVGVGGGIGSGVGILTVTLAVDPTAQRIARSTAAESTAYVAPRTIALARGLLGVACAAAALGLVCVLAGTLTMRQGLTFVLLPFVGAVGCSIAFEVLMRLVTDRAQRATSELELAWDDVLRAHGMRQAATSSIIVSGACAVLVAVGLLSGTAAAPMAELAPAVLLGAVGGIGGLVAMILVSTEPGYRVLQQLWPRADFGAGTEPEMR